MKKINIRIFSILIPILFNYFNVCSQNKTIVIDSTYKCSCDIDSIDNQKVFKIVEKMAEFVGGTEKFNDFLIQNAHVYDINKEEEIPSIIYLTFIIDSQGNVRDICVYKRKYSSYENEYMRVMTLSPKWKPAEVNGVKVPVRISIPVRLELK